MNTIFSPFPKAELSKLPTPVIALPSLGATYNHDRLFMKQDNLSGPIYGGNKIRKLEFLLGEALENGCKTVITYGAAGSNHALATAVCCQQLGLHAISILAPQETNEHARKNVLMQHAVGAELHLVPDYTHFPELTRQLSEKYENTPYIIPTGGTNAIGALGFVNAALEMAKQIKPDVIYLPMGTGGTLAGLLVGLKLAGLHNTRIEAIRVVDPTFRNETHIKALCDDLFKKLFSPLASLEDTETKAVSSLCSSVFSCGKKNLRISKSEIVIRNEFYGEDYGIPTAAGREAIDVFQTLENVPLENTYTGKTAAALLHDLRSGALDGQTVLYWNTLNSRDFSKEIADLDFHALPSNFHPYFES